MPRPANLHDGTLYENCLERGLGTFISGPWPCPPPPSSHSSPATREGSETMNMWSWSGDSPPAHLLSTRSREPLTKSLAPDKESCILLPLSDGEFSKIRQPAAAPVGREGGRGCAILHNYSKMENCVSGIVSSYKCFQFQGHPGSAEEHSWLMATWHANTFIQPSPAGRLAATPPTSRTGELGLLWYFL